MELATVPLSVVHFRGIKRVHTKLEKLPPGQLGRGSKSMKTNYQDQGEGGEDNDCKGEDEHEGKEKHQ